MSIIITCSKFQISLFIVPIAYFFLEAAMFDSIILSDEQRKFKIPRGPTFFTLSNSSFLALFLYMIGFKMKLSVPACYNTSNSPSSSSPSLIFYTDMCSSRKSSGCCIAGIFRRILCSGSLPTHPSDQIKDVDLSAESDKVQEFKPSEKSDENEVEETTNIAPPGIVARLMGLDSMPEIKLTITKQNPREVSRSRSMNFLDRFGKCEQTFDLHDKVRSTLSFRDLPVSLPALLEVENEKYLVFKFENESESKERRSNSKVRKSEKGFGELKQRRSERCQNKENLQAADQSLKENTVKSKGWDDKLSEKSVKNVGGLNDITNTMRHSKRWSDISKMVSETEKHLELYVRSPKPKKKRKKATFCRKKKIDHELSSQDSSPVSVLDFHSWVPSRSADEGASLSSRREWSLSAKLELDLQSESARIDGHNFLIDGRNNKVFARSKRCGSKDHQRDHDVWSIVCRIVEAEDELVKKGMWKQGDMESVAADIGFQILDELLDEMTDEIVEVGYHLDTYYCKLY